MRVLKFFKFKAPACGHSPRLNFTYPKILGRNPDQATPLYIYVNVYTYTVVYMALVVVFWLSV